MVSEITNNDDVTMPASSVSCQLNKNDELESSTVRPLPWNPSISVTKNGVVNIIGNNIENHYVIKKTAVTVGTNQNPETCTSTVAEKWRNFVFGDRRKKIYTAVFITTCLLIGAVVMTAVLTSSVHHEMKGHRCSKWPTNASFEYVTKDEWHAVAVRIQEVDPLNVTLPKLVLVSHTALESPNFCFTREHCIETVLQIQTSQISGGKLDTPYNFLIGGDGRLYEGRGWGKTAAHTLGYNFCSIGLALIGDFTNNSPTKAQVSTALNFLDLSALIGCLDKNYTVLGQSQVVTTPSPGRQLIQIMKTWKHWTPFDGNKTALDCYQL